MSVVIDMDMPDDCFKCQINRVCSHRWFLNPDEGRPDDCPIKAELPAKHGDLIDRNELKKEFPKDTDWEYPVNTNEYVCEMIDEAKPVIEAEDE